MLSNRCECCGEVIKIHKHTYNKRMLKLLIEMYKRDKTNIHLSKNFDTTYETAYDVNLLMLYNHIELLENEYDEEYGTQFSIITEEGVKFLNGEVSVPEFVHVRLNKVWTFEGYSKFRTDIED